MYQRRSRREHDRRGYISERIFGELFPAPRSIESKMSLAVDLDTQLMIRVQSDDALSFSELLNRNRNMVVNYLSRMVVNRSIAEELAQDVFIRVYRSRQTYEPTAKFSTWLYRITTNVALNYFRDEKRTRNE